jgi:hypothetical protein
MNNKYIHGSKTTERIWKTLLTGLILQAFLLTILFFLLPYFSKIDPFYHLLFGDSNFLSKIARSFLLTCVGYHWIVSSVPIVLYFFATIYLCCNGLSCISASQRYQSKIYYAAIHIVIQSNYSVVKITAAFAIFGGSILFIATTTASIKYHHSMRFLVYVHFPVDAFLMAVLLGVIIDFAGKIHTGSKKVLGQYRITLEKSSGVNDKRKHKLAKMILRSLKPLAVQVGTFFEISQTTVISLYMVLIDQTIELLCM